ncbi:hypothetical protein EYF80_041741 [Liparis tanakae]|uniref:Pyrin domain-containing protein n=1 Tax=Liparis tanakae TaxID=230148 RepID=A0A4Z2G381_9TELE|nr:hypothetical protein EYF80_041741 [Liparis tanakae]
MTSVPLLLLDTLDDLSHEDFKRFQWLLENGVLDSCRPVARSRLEDTDRAGTVSAMTRDYGEGMAVNVGVEILKQMGNNNAAEKLRRRRAGLCVVLVLSERKAHRTHHCGDVQLVVQGVGPVVLIQGHFGQRHRSAEVEEGRDAVIGEVLTDEEEEDKRRMTFVPVMWRLSFTETQLSQTHG